MVDYQMHKQVWQYHQQGNIKPGRPMKRWLD